MRTRRELVREARVRRLWQAVVVARPLVVGAAGRAVGAQRMQPPPASVARACREADRVRAWDVGVLEPGASVAVPVRGRLPAGGPWHWHPSAQVVGTGDAAGGLVSANAVLVVWLPRTVAGGEVLLGRLTSERGCTVQVRGRVERIRGWRVGAPATWPAVVHEGGWLTVRWTVVNSGNAPDTLVAQVVSPPGWPAATVRVRAGAVARRGEVEVEATVRVPSPAGYSHPVLELQASDLARGTPFARATGPVRWRESEALAQRRTQADLVIGGVHLLGGRTEGPSRVVPTVRGHARVGRVDIAADVVFAPPQAGQVSQQLARVGVVPAIPSLAITAPTWSVRGGSVAWTPPSGELLGVGIFGVGVRAQGATDVVRWTLLASTPWSRDAARPGLSTLPGVRQLAVQSQWRMSDAWAVSLGASSLREPLFGDALLRQWESGFGGGGVLADSLQLVGPVRWSDVVDGARILDAVAVGAAGRLPAGVVVRPEVALRHVGDGSLSLGYGGHLGLERRGLLIEGRYLHAPGGLTAFAAATDQASATLRRWTSRASWSSRAWWTDDLTRGQRVAVRGVNVSPMRLGAGWTFGLRTRASERVSRGPSDSGQLGPFALQRRFAELEALVGGTRRLGDVQLQAWAGGGRVRESLAGGIARDREGLGGAPPIQWRWEALASRRFGRGQWQLARQGAVRAQWAGDVRPVWTRRSSARVFDWHPWRSPDWLGVSAAVEHVRAPAIRLEQGLGASASVDVAVGRWSLRLGTERVPLLYGLSSSLQGSAGSGTPWRSAVRVERAVRVVHGDGGQRIPVMVCRVVVRTERTCRGNGIAGVRVSTAAGRVLTDARGHAMVPVRDAQEQVVVDIGTLPAAVQALVSLQPAGLSARQVLHFPVIAVGQFRVTLSPDAALRNDPLMPWSAVRVFAEDASGQLWRPTRDSDTTFVFPALPAGRYRTVVDTRGAAQRARLVEDTTWYTLAASARDAMVVRLLGRPVQLQAPSLEEAGDVPVMIAFPVPPAAPAARRPRPVAPAPSPVVAPVRPPATSPADRSASPRSPRNRGRKRGGRVTTVWRLGAASSIPSNPGASPRSKR